MLAGNRYYRAVWQGQPPLGIAGYFELTRASPEWPATQGRALRRFLIHTAYWSLTPGYEKLIGRLEPQLARHPRWRDAIHADDASTAGSRTPRYATPDVGELHLLIVDLYGDWRSGFVLQAHVPVASSFKPYAKYKAAVDLRDSSPIWGDWVD